ncbi:RING finger protein 17 isoform X1 [Lucilia sericata]|uniref:RING finger protein 17 isoform X1 n=1 Tax=Lucilia sericata TaxID=13632 RepID=UPI0018A86560|nr:RING finger protein 17 isoform X1 [Lucilia sericata]
MLNNFHGIKLFDSRFVANTLNNARRCPKCRNEYSFYYDTAERFASDYHVKSNRPILLACGHNMCENCVYHNRHNLTCGTCLKPIPINQEPTKQFTNFNVRDYFDMNFFLMGQLNHWRFHRKDGSGNNTLLMSAPNRSNLNISLHDADASAASVIKCGECELVPSLGKCRICKCYYCKRCFDNVHKNSKILKLHTLQRFDKETTPYAELIRLTKSRFCKRHQRHSDRYCSKCDLVCCGECARQDHQHHHYRKLVDENEKLMDELHITLDNAQLARECLNKGQKDIKSVETQLEEYATKTLEEISNYYVQLHSFLQNEEKQIMDKFSEMCQQPQFMLREANIKLNESQETLNSIRGTLEKFQHTPPTNFHLGHILPKYNQLIQQIPSNIHITKPQTNPFIFEIKHDIRPAIHNSIEYNYKDPKILIKIDTSFYDSNPSTVNTTATSVPSTINITQNSSVSPKPKTNKKNNKKNKKNKNINSNNDISMANRATVSNSNQDASNLVHITNIKSPENFYIQNVNDIQPIRKLSHTYLLNAIANNIPKIIAEGYYYMAYHITDKQWYRGMLKKTLPNDLYKIFLVDFGVSMEVSKDKLCDIEERHLKIPFAAIRCAIYDIMPVGKKWTEVENNLLLELLHNKPARISIIEKVNNEMLKIDLHTELSKSVHDTFLYTGLARERPGVHSFKLQIKSNLPIIKIEERIPKMNIQAGEILQVTVLYVEGPEEFYVIKNDLIESKEQLRSELNQYYNNNAAKLQQIYLGTVQMCCAVKIKDVWYRAVIEEIKDRGQLNIRLVDEGRREIINWRQAFVLNEQFRKKREFALPCTLADIEPLQENKYVYTAAAIKDFKQMTTNPLLRMEVVAVTSKIYKVVLYICKKTLDINIGATLVKNKFGISTGESTQITEVLKTLKSNTNNQPFTIISNDDNLKTITATTKPIKRTLVKVTHLINPGEFYIQLLSLIQGTKAFHQQIQENQAKKCGSKLPLPYETREWFENNHCLVYTKYHNSQSTQPPDGPLVDQFEWYRGIITKISYLPGKEPTFSVFLRDIGVTICSIYAQQLYSIDPQLDRVTNAVYCCHLACIEPAGGSTWSQSSIDSFRHYVTTAETLSVSLHGKRNQEKNSLAIVLWSSKMETANPLAPCITKYSNINRNLVRKGLAHMVEPLDTKQQFDQIEEMELANGEITLEQWFKSFSDNVLLKDLENSEKMPLHLSIVAGEVMESNEFYMDDHPLSIHLNEMDFKDTTGQRAPPAWFTSKVITKTLFSGYPTYIDFDCIVYLHEADDKKFLEKITKKLTETYGPIEPPSKDYRFAIDQACVVKYHVDSKYYRGIITADMNAEREWTVQFIDYGNVETVELKDLRPYAPFPNLPALASKYIIDGIKPKDGAVKFNVGELDQMHAMLVTKFISIRIHPSQLQKEIKRCNLYLGAIDVGNLIIERGLAEADYRPFFDNSIKETSPLILSQLDGDLNAVSLHKSHKTRNPLPIAPVEDYAIFSQNNNMSIDCEEMVEEDNNNDLSDNSEISFPENDGDQSDKFDHLNEMLDRLSKPNNIDTFRKPLSKPAIETTRTTNKPPPPKKRMFNDKDYTKMMNVMMVYDNDDIVDNYQHEFDLDDQHDNDDEEGDDDDIIELEQSFAMNYWHNTVEDMRLEEDEEIIEQLDRRALLSFEDQDIESDFDVFHPYETSTVFSHFSGIENFKPPQLPTAMHHFTCSIVSIITPTILQIFPNHAEFRYREVELQRCIKEVVKRCPPPLTKFEPSTLCLACYTKDKIWYRAIIRSYNPNAKTVDVLYVDYLNSETLPLKYVRQCPKDLLGWPLRTFRVRLHGIKLNPHVKENEVRLALHQLLNKRKLFGVVKKHPNYSSLVLGTTTVNDSDLIEIALYESKEASLKGVTIYEPLIEKEYFQRF